MLTCHLCVALKGPNGKYWMLLKINYLYAMNCFMAGFPDDMTAYRPNMGSTQGERARPGAVVAARLWRLGLQWK